MKVYSANLQSQGKKYAIVLARFNEFIVSKLLDGCLDGLKRHGVMKRKSKLSGFQDPLKSH